VVAELRIVHVANAYTPRSGGIRTTVHALGRGYRAAGHELVLVVPGPRPADEVLPWGRRVVLPGPRVPGSGGYRLLTDLGSVRAVLDDLQPDRLEVSDRVTLRSLGGWARSAGVPSLVIVHERLDLLLGAFTPLSAAARRRLADRHNTTTARCFDRVVTTTRFAAQEFHRIDVPTDHVPLGVDLDRFRPPVPGPTSVGSRPWLSPRHPGPLLVLSSRLSREKRPDLAVEALRALHRQGVLARLIVAGAGPLTHSLRRRAGGLPVHLLGHVGERAALADLLGAADVVLAPGPAETFGLAALEALACGTPVVASSTSALAEIVIDGAGRSAAPNPDALAQAVIAVLGVPEARRSAAARRRAEAFPWSRTTSTLLELHGAPQAVAGPGQSR
jgi:alpha-1,6-mannosyltransferase